MNPPDRRQLQITPVPPAKKYTQNKVSPALGVPGFRNHTKGNFSLVPMKLMYSEKEEANHQKKILLLGRIS